MKIIKFDPVTFDNFLHVSLEKWANSSDRILVLGVKEGGIILAKKVYQFFADKKSLQVDLNFVTCQRPSTKVKKKNKRTEQLMKSIFQYTPRIVLNQLRVIEHQLLSGKKQNPTREMSSEENINYSAYSKIMIVDDAVDSGYSLKHIIEFINQQVDQTTEIATLAVVVTQKEPVVKPNFYLYKEVLIRFPWSLDA